MARRIFWLIHANRAAYGRLCQLLSKGKLRAGKGECLLRFDDLAEFSTGLLLVVMPSYRLEAAKILRTLDALGRLPAEGIWLAATMFFHGDDKRRMRRVDKIATTARVPLIATNDVLYHFHRRRALQDVVTCIREKATIREIGKKLEAHAERHLQPHAAMERLYKDYPAALEENRSLCRPHFLFSRSVEISLSR